MHLRTVNMNDSQHIKRIISNTVKGNITVTELNGITKVLCETKMQKYLCEDTLVLHGVPDEIYDVIEMHLL